MTKIEFLNKNLVNPVTGKKCVLITNDKAVFDCGTEYSSVDGKPIIIDESESIFRVKEVVQRRPTAQNEAYRNSSLKNFIRKKCIPSLSKDFNQNKRYNKLSKNSSIKKVLIIGAGDKVKFYSEIFNNALVITSDVHLLFSPDLVFDAHQVPFKDECFDLVIASQVLEHTLQPWVVANELERVVRLDGNLLIETPFNFPYHSPPYDFFRFTFTGLRSLFPESKLSSFEASEGSASSLATFSAQFLVDLFSNRYLRMVMLFISRFLFGWLKYLDLLKKSTTFLSIFSPMGFSMLFTKDKIQRTKKELLNVYYDLQASK